MIDIFDMVVILAIFLQALVLKRSGILRRMLTKRVETLEDEVMKTRSRIATHRLLQNAPRLNDLLDRINNIQQEDYENRSAIARIQTQLDSLGYSIEGPSPDNINERVETLARQASRDILRETQEEQRRQHADHIIALREQDPRMHAPLGLPTNAAVQNMTEHVIEIQDLGLAVGTDNRINLHDAGFTFAQINDSADLQRLVLSGALYAHNLPLLRTGRAAPPYSVSYQPLRDRISVTATQQIERDSSSSWEDQHTQEQLAAAGYTGLADLGYSDEEYEDPDDCAIPKEPDLIDVNNIKKRRRAIKHKKSEISEKKERK